MIGGPYVWLIATIAFMAALAGAGYKGFGLGKATIQADWDRAIIEARDEADKQRKADQAKAKQLASRYEAKIATQALASREIAGQLDAELKRKPLPLECVIPDGVRELVNAALRGESIAGAVVPATGGAAAAAKVERP